MSYGWAIIAGSKPNSPAKLGFGMRNLTGQCEFLAQMLEKTIRQAVPQEIHFLQKFDRARSAIAEVVDLPDRKREQLLMRLHKNGGKLARKRREGEFSELTEQEMTDIESAYHEAFSN